MPIVLACLEISWVEISTCPGGKRLRQYQKWLKIPIQGWSNHSHTPWPFNHDGRSPCSRQTSIFKNQENSNIFQPIAIFDSQRVSTPLYSLSWGQFSNPCPGPRRSCSSHSLPLSIVCPCRSSIERPMSPVAWPCQATSVNAVGSENFRTSWCQNPPTTILPGATLFPKDTEA